MNIHPHRMAVAVLLCGALVSAALANGGGTNTPARPAPSGAGAATGYIEKFEVPERDDNGNLKWKLIGERAVIRPDGLMDVQNARAEFYTSNKVDMVFSSPTCLLDRMNNHATTDDRVRIERENMVLTGIGGEWDGNTTSMVIRSNVVVVITNAQPILGEPPKPQ